MSIRENDSEYPKADIEFVKFSSTVVLKLTIELKNVSNRKQKKGMTVSDHTEMCTYLRLVLFNDIFDILLLLSFSIPLILNGSAVIS